jgi:ligand-binding SRPBCC domain-containing protein
MYRFTSQLLLPRPREDVFSFFAEAHNLEVLTPAWLRFEVLTPSPIVMEEGTLIEYKLRIRGVAVRWQSQITTWEPPYRFVDVQRRGPYRAWIHEHRFVERGEFTCAFDHVDYDHAGGWIVNRLLVAPDLRRIFDFRLRKLKAHFDSPSKEP